jgi:hypothetical protein
MASEAQRLIVSCLTPVHRQALLKEQHLLALRVLPLQDLHR